MYIVSKDSPFQDVEEVKFTPEEAEVIRLLETHRWHRVRIHEITFKRGVRTVWHKHLGSQILVVQKGKGVVQETNGPAALITPGDIVYIQPGKKHWHGATARNHLSHISIIIGGETDWFEEVSDEDYKAALDALT